jgi:hypothetical protein
MVKSNILYEIFIAVTAFVDPSLNVHERIHRITEVVSSFNCNVYILSLDSVVKIYQDLQISEVTTLQFYENLSLSITLSVIKDDLEESWLHLCKSCIPNSGFGVFAARSFQKNEFIMCYLGELTDHTEGSYIFKKINGFSLSMGNVDNYGNFWNCLGQPLLVSDHWFAHRIQHGSEGKVNVKISKQYVVSSLRKITVGEELFMDYNHDCKCVKYDVWCNYFFPPFLYNHFCSMCGRESIPCKRCSECYKCHLCVDCYDRFQI